MGTSTSVSLERISETESINFLLQHALENELPLAFWRLPNSNLRHLILSTEYRMVTRENPMEELPTGFMFAPFHRSKPSYFLPGDYFFTFEDNALKSPETPAEIRSATWLAGQLKSAHQNKKRYSGEKSSNLRSTHSYTDLVSQAISAIESSEFEKVVLSRTKEIELKEDFDLVETFEKLCKTYPLALISFVSIPEVGSWLGATPEALVSVEGGTIFKTVALAGTLPFQEGMNLRDVAWTQKEIEEQALVERYIISCFKKIRLREYDENGPKTVVAGNLLHLRSEFIVDLKATNFPQLGSVMLDLLHPTSAVCGVPLEPSLNFIRKNEGHDREFYAGYLGPVNVHNNINLYVNLRCLKLLDGKAILFAGAGVTVDSIPEKELEETEMKFKTLLNVIS
jgi:isochorismate synthase